MSKNKVAIIMGSDSDLPNMKGAVEALRLFSVDHEVKIVSAHRTPEYMFDYAKEAEGRGFSVIIAGAGGAAHLPGMVAALTSLPVIGVPISHAKLKGLDALLSIAQMPKGVPVATVAIDNSFNAGLLAAKIVALADLKVRRGLVKYSREQKNKVKLANKILKSRVKI